MPEAKNTASVDGLYDINEASVLPGAIKWLKTSWHIHSYPGILPHDIGAQVWKSSVEVHRKGIYTPFGGDLYSPILESVIDPSHPGQSDLAPAVVSDCSLYSSQGQAAVTFREPLWIFLGSSKQRPAGIVVNDALVKAIGQVRFISDRPAFQVSLSVQASPDVAPGCRQHLGS